MVLVLELVEEVVPNVESIRIIEGGDDFKQIVARVSVDRTETIAHGDVFPHFEGHRYRSLGTMQLIDGEDWKPNHLGTDVRFVDVGVVEVEPDGSSFIRMRLPKRLLVGRDIDPSRLSELDAAGKKRFAKRLAHLERDDATPAERAVFAKKRKKKRKR